MENLEAQDKAKAVEAMEAAMRPRHPYTIDLYLEGHPGLFRYGVSTREQAMNHFAAITSTGYRRVNDRGMMEWYSPSMIKFIRINGPGLETNYPDQFLRT